MSRRASYNSKKLTELLHELGQQPVTVGDDGTPLTREQMLADLLWKKALGWTEQVTVEKELKDEFGNKSTRTTTEDKVHPPENWAIQMIWERREGKAPLATTDETSGRPTTRETVRKLARERLNKMTEARAVPPPPPFPGQADG